MRQGPSFGAVGVVPHHWQVYRTQSHFLLKIAPQTKIRIIPHHYFKIASNRTDTIKVDPT
jgi:hypothetical protein